MVRYVVAAALVVAVAASAAAASAPPVGPLPRGPATAISVPRGELFAVALPKPARGRVWRIARAYNANVVTQVSEGVQRGNIVVVYRALRAGRTTLSYALTLGETSKALQAHTFKVGVG
ncbi:MAG TPA: hypothetical protein VJP39_03355 [Gaiellaceae bacterium]|nr:hypothetical protein [Gaiellaceae bacterium]